MQDICFKENKEHGDVSFPFAFYHVTNRHPRYVMEPHWHEEVEICRVLNGELHLKIDGKTYHGKGRNGEGDIFFINSGSLHSAEPVDCVYECIVFDLHFLLRERSSSNSFLYSLLYNQRQFVPFIQAASPALSSRDPISKSLPFVQGSEVVQTQSQMQNKQAKQNHASSIKPTSASKIQDDSVDALHKNIDTYAPVLPPQLQAQVCRVINNLFDVLHDQNSGHQLKTFGLMYYLIGLFEDHDLFMKPDTPREAVSRIMKMRLALSYIHRNYKQDISLTNLSSLLELKPPSVVKLFRDIINKRPMEYVNSYRIHCAMEMLKSDNCSVTAVAFDCGFSDVSYFSKVFKKYAGKTPREFLKTVNEEMLL